ncbi:hypothetical membrane protein [Pseudomonas knackmussii B13]|uniref:Hypothetical membrane protein n=1 Tax=Pseudomonas knackmussii (strain DSM 6978 / CCUG 54928 / LMG 23759 / B13) TaxID=1301098 RepID=A0A024HBX3_PSEKB|nr:oligosaccharide flippase family protein [Pseudomonas knackmussii]CDF82555.1 hypothetical membrane protein [Pseudomonas knackmussii B13]
MHKREISKTIISELTARALGLSLSLLLARQLDIDSFGRWNYLQAVLLYFIVFIEFGSNQEGIRSLIKAKGNKELFNSELQNILSNRTLGLFLSAACLGILGITNLLSIGEALSLAACVIAYSMSKDWYLRAIGKQLLASIPNTTHLGILIATVTLLTLTSNTKLLNPESLTALKGIALALLTLTITITCIPHSNRKHFKPRIKPPSANVIYLVSGSLLAKAYFNADILLIEHILGSHQVGIYSAISTLYITFIAFRGVVINSLYPSLCNTENSAALRKKVLKLSTSFGAVLLPIFAIIFLTKSGLISIFLGSRYLSTQALELTNIFVATCVALSFGLLYPNALHIYGKGRTFFFLTLIGAAINITGNILYLPKIGIIAAAYTTFLSELFIVTSSATIFIIASKKRLK